MEVTELRIGNWYHQEASMVTERNQATGELKRVTNYEDKNICLTREDLHLQVSNIFNKPELEGIILTEENLVKFNPSFNKVNKLYYKHAGVHAIGVEIFSKFSRVKLVSQELCTIKYVHELQDICSLLTRKKV